MMDATYNQQNYFVFRVDNEEPLKVTDEEIDFLLKCGCICEERANELRRLVERRNDGN